MEEPHALRVRGLLNCRPPVAEGLGKVRALEAELRKLQQDLLKDKDS